MEAHHDAGLERVARIVDRVGLHEPARFARRVDDGVLRIVGPFLGAAHRIVPDDLLRLRARREKVVDEVETVLEFLRRTGLHVDLEGARRLRAVPGRFKVDGRRADLVGFGLFFALSLEDARVAHFDRVHVVGVEAPDGNSAVGEKGLRPHVVADFLTALFRNDAHRRLREDVAAVADHGRERRDVVWIDDDRAEFALDDPVDLRARGTARGHDGKGQGKRERRGQKGLFAVHVDSLGICFYDADRSYLPAGMPNTVLPMFGAPATFPMITVGPRQRLTANLRVGTSRLGERFLM